MDVSLQETSTWAFLLAFLGVCFLFLEVLIPSGGLIFIVALSCLGGAVYCAWDAWWDSHPGYFGAYIAGMAISLPVIGIWVFRLWERVILRADEEELQMTRSNPGAELLPLVGKSGRTVTPLTPAGIVQIDGERIHASSEGMIVERDQPVTVVDVRSNRLVVRYNDPATHPPTDQFADASGTDDEPLDFDVSEG